MRLRDVALACALGEAGRGVHEVGGNNQGVDVMAYLAEAGIKVPAAWCAALVNTGAHRGARLLGLESPLELVPRQALVADYVELARTKGWLVTPEAAHRGDLVAFKFGPLPQPWNHIGFVMDRPVGGRFWTVEGNTGSAGGRDGDGVYVKQRSFDPARVCFIAWDGGADPNPAAA